MAGRWFNVVLLALIAAVASFSVATASTSVPTRGERIVYRQGTSTVIGEFRGPWPDEAKTAFGVAANTIAATVAIQVPIVVSAEWADLGPSTLGRGGPESLFVGFSGAPKPDIYYPAALANQYHGARLAEGIDIGTSYNSTTTWYYGTDARPGPTQSDFVTTVIHEMLHGMGFLGTFTVGDNGATWGDDDGSVSPNKRGNVTKHVRDLFGFKLKPERRVPLLARIVGQGVASSDVYDQWLVTGSGQRLLDTNVFPRASDALKTALTSNDLYWDGPAATAANSGKPVKLYAPDPWASSSSVSHLDDATYDGTPEAIFTAAGERISSTAIGPIVRGMMTDMGWTITP